MPAMEPEEESMLTDAVNKHGTNWVVVAALVLVA
jgi:hypothetical protein